jgi:hypothetical protein
VQCLRHRVDQRRAGLCDPDQDVPPHVVGAKAAQPADLLCQGVVVECRERVDDALLVWLLISRSEPDPRAAVPPPPGLVCQRGQILR